MCDRLQDCCTVLTYAGQNKECIQAGHKFQARNKRASVHKNELNSSHFSLRLHVDGGSNAVTLSPLTLYIDPPSDRGFCGPVQSCRISQTSVRGRILRRRFQRAARVGRTASAVSWPSRNRGCRTREYRLTVRRDSEVSKARNVASAFRSR